MLFLLVVGYVLVPLLVPFANLILIPVQRAINRWYIRDAQKKLRPGLTVIGVTGRYGKTSVKEYITEMLSLKYNVLATPASYNTPMGVVRTIRERLEAPHEILVCEMGARHSGDIRELCEIVHPAVGVLTAIGPQHLETFKTQETVTKTKFELIDALPPGGRAFLNWDNAVIREAAGNRSAVRYGGDSSSDVWAENLTAGSGGLSFELVTVAGERQTCTTGLLGRHSVQNITAAAAVALSFGLTLRELVPVIRGLKPARHRLELLPKGNGLTVIDDAYNANPAGAAAALEALALFDGVKIIITPGMIELGPVQERENRSFGQKIAQVCDYAALVGERQTKPIAEGLANFPGLKIFESFTEAYQWAVELETGGREKIVLIENDLPDQYS